MHSLACRVCELITQALASISVEQVDLKCILRQQILLKFKSSPDAINTMENQSLLHVFYINRAATSRNGT